MIVEIPDEAMTNLLGREWSKICGHGSICPACAKHCERVALTKLVYTFEVCTCSATNYPHLAERLWHRDCFAAGVAKATSEANR